MSRIHTCPDLPPRRPLPIQMRGSLQLGPVDCGPANLRALCDGWGMHIGNARIRAACGVNNAGSSLFGLHRASLELGLEAKLMPLDLIDLRKHADLYLPAIVKINTVDEQLHFVTIHRFQGDRVRVMDPAAGLLYLPFDELWIRMDRQYVIVAHEKIEHECTDPANIADIEARLKSAGVSASEANDWITEYGLFRMDDALKYVELLYKKRDKDALGGAEALLRGLLTGPDFRVPRVFDSDVHPLDSQPYDRIRSPLVLVVLGPDGSREEESQAFGSPRRRLFRFFGGYLRSWLPLALLAVCMSVLGLVIPLSSGWVIDSLDVGWPPLLLVLLATGFVRLIHSYVIYAYTIGLSRLQTAISARLRSGLLVRFQELPEWLMKDRMPGELVSRLEESGQLGRFVTIWGLGVLTSTISLMVAMVLMYRFWWPMLILTALAMVISTTINELFARRLRLLTRDTLESAAQYYTMLMDLFRGLETVRLVEAGASALFSGDSRFATRVRADYRQQDWRLLARSALGGLEGVTTLATAILTYWGLSRGEGTPGTIVTSLTLSTMARASLQALLEHRRTAEHESVILERCEEFLDHVPGEDAVAELGVQFDRAETAWSSLNLEKISFAYDSRRAVLNGLDLKLRPGRTVCLLGDSGTGKSTLMDLLCGLLEPNVGCIKIDGNRTDGPDRRDLGVFRVEQEPFLVSGTILENILLGLPSPGIELVVRAAETASFLPVVDRDPRGWQRWIGGRRQGLSGGEARRLCLVRALLRRPAILLLDETLISVDGEQRARILRALADDRPDRAIVLATHDPADAFLCDEVIILEGGRIAESGSPKELLRNESSRFGELLVAGEVVR